jgi:hypothetical protein
VENFDHDFAKLLTMLNGLAFGLVFLGLSLLQASLAISRQPWSLLVPTRLTYNSPFVFVPWSFNQTQLEMTP